MQQRYLRWCSALQRLHAAWFFFAARCLHGRLTRTCSRALRLHCYWLRWLQVSGGDTLLDVDFASFIDSFLLAPPGAEDDCLRSEGEQGGADQVCCFCVFSVVGV